MISENDEELSQNEAHEFLQKCVARLEEYIDVFKNSSQNHSSISGFYPQCKNDQWTCGFYPGELWLAYEFSGKEIFKEAGQNHVILMKNRIEKKISVDHHDMGFLYSPSCVAPWKILKDEVAKKSALLAADQLISRFQERGEFIQAWGEMGEKENYRYIVDCLLNTPLLYWASRETKNPVYADIARRHTKTCMENSIRPDGSTFHTFFMDINSGKPLYGKTCQGYSDDSFWARGQTWGIYGSALAYRYDEHEEYFYAFKRTVKFFLEKLPADNVPYWDLIFNDENASSSRFTEPRDSSSAAIAACGLLDMARQLQKKDSVKYNEEINYYEHAAKVMMKSLCVNYFAENSNKSNGLVLHGTYSKKSPYNTCTPEGVDECVSWGDYFFMEALTRLVNPDWELYW